MRLLNLVNRYLISIIVFCGIFYFSTKTLHYTILPHIYGADKLYHILMYFALSFSLSMENSVARFSYRIALVLIMPIIYGGLIEIIQEYYFPPRTGDWLDWAADAIGAALGCYMASKVYSVHIIRKIFRR